MESEVDWTEGVALDVNSAIVQRLIRLRVLVKETAKRETDNNLAALLTWFGGMLDNVLSGEEQPGRSLGS